MTHWSRCRFCGLQPRRLLAGTLVLLAAAAAVRLWVVFRTTLPAAGSGDGRGYQWRRHHRQLSTQHPRSRGDLPVDR